jgi:hypothetical protein
MFDTDFYIQRIIQSGASENTAREIVRGIVDSQVELVSKRDLNEAVAGLKSAIVLLDKTMSLKIMGLYAFISLVAVGVAKLVFMP